MELGGQGVNRGVVTTNDKVGGYRTGQGSPHTTMKIWHLEKEKKKAGLDRESLNLCVDLHTCLPSSGKKLAFQRSLTWADMTRHWWSQLQWYCGDTQEERGIAWRPCTYRLPANPTRYCSASPLLIGDLRYTSPQLSFPNLLFHRIEVGVLDCCLPRILGCFEIPE
jgi:hypothetical protein